MRIRVILRGEDGLEFCEELEADSIVAARDTAMYRWPDAKVVETITEAQHYSQAADREEFLRAMYEDPQFDNYD